MVLPSGSGSGVATIEGGKERSNESLLVEFLQQEGFEVDTLNAIFKPNIFQGIAKKKVKAIFRGIGGFFLTFAPPARNWHPAG